MMADATCCVGILSWCVIQLKMGFHRDRCWQKVLSMRVLGGISGSSDGRWAVRQWGTGAWRPLTKTGRRGQAEVSPSAALGWGVLSMPESYSSSPKHTEAQGLIPQLPTGSCWGLFNFFLTLPVCKAWELRMLPQPGNKPPGRELQVFTQAPSVPTEQRWRVWTGLTDSCKPVCVWVHVWSTCTQART